MSPGEARTVRIDDRLWRRAKSKAALEGRTISDVVRACLEAYVEEDQETD